MSLDPEHGLTTSFLLSQVGAVMAQRFAELLAGGGVAPREFAVMEVVGREGPQTQQRLADALGMHRNNMTALVDGLIQRGLVSRRAHPTDGRAVLIHLTDLGTDALARAGQGAPMLDADIELLLGEKSAQALNTILRELAARLSLPPGVHPHLAATYPGSRRLRT